jgi:hypothetical protein
MGNKQPYQKFTKLLTNNIQLNKNEVDEVISKCREVTEYPYGIKTYESYYKLPEKHSEENSQSIRRFIVFTYTSKPKPTVKCKLMFETWGRELTGNCYIEYKINCVVEKFEYLTLSIVQNNIDLFTNEVFSKCMKVFAKHITVHPLPEMKNI